MTLKDQPAMLHSQDGHHPHLFQFHLETIYLKSKLLRGNPMGNSCERVFYALKPAKKPQQTQKPVVVYMLDGYFGNGASMLSSSGAVGASLPEDLFALQIQNKIPPMHFVFPDPSTRIGGSQYLDSLSCGPFAAHFTEELVPYYEKKAGLENPFRVLAGHSSGGYGALCLPIYKPGFFHASIVSAADSCFEHSLKASFGTASIRLRKAGGIENFLTQFFAKESPEKCNSQDFSTLMILAMGSCYSPELGLNSVHTQLPFDLDTLEVKAEVWNQWLSKDPVHFSNEHLTTLGALQFLHFDCGDADEYFAQFGHRILSRRLNSLGIKHTITEFPGGHSGTRFRYKDRLARLSQFLSESILH